jgi:KaiB-like protein
LKVELILYLAGHSAASVRARRNLDGLMAGHAGADIRVEIKDVSDDVEAAERDHVVFTPTLIIRAGGIETRAIGDLADGSALTGILTLGGVEKNG